MTYYTPDQWRGTVLGAEGRIALRKAVAAHDGWSDYRAARHLPDTGNLAAPDLIDAALALGIDIAAVTGRTPTAGTNEPHKPRVHGPDVIRALADRLEPVAGYLSARSIKLCREILETIRTKQDGRATVKQFDCILRAVEKGEAKMNQLLGIATAPTAPAPVAPTPAIFLEPTLAAAPVAPAPANNAASQLAGLISQLAGEAMNPAAVRALVQQEIEAALKNGPVLRIEVKAANGIVRPLEGKQHPKMPSLLRAASARMADGFAPNIWISGPAGSGKTHSAKEVAKALGLDFYMHGAAAMSYELLGFIDAGGVYHRTAFRDAFEHGGVVLWDEIDAWDNGAMLAMKAALGNGQCRFPDATVKRHPDCIIIGAANTFGLGATADYVGRAKIDAALLSSFPVRLFWAYDEELEAAICGNPQWAARVQRARAKAAAAGLKVLIDPRASQAGAALVAAGATFDEAAAETYLANLTADQRRIVEG